jgi:hypothetical protein
MTWVKLDDGFFDHPKAIAAGPLARELNFAAWCWSASNLTDGRIPRHVLPLIAAKAGVKPALANMLVDVGLWKQNGDGWIVNDFLVYNKSRNEVEDERERWRLSKRMSRRDSPKDSNGEST